MGWARLDDGWHDHRKTVDVGLEAAGLWVMCLTWAHKERRTKPDTAGVVPDSIITRFAGSAAKARKLTARLREVGYLDDHTPSGWPIHDFDQYLPKGHDPEKAREYGLRGGRPKKPPKVSDENLGSFPTGTSDKAEPKPDEVSERKLPSRAPASARRNPEPVPEPKKPVPPTAGGGAAGAEVLPWPGDVERADPDTPGGLIGYWSDLYEVPPLPPIRSQIGKEIRAVHGKATPDQIRTACRRLVAKASNPGALPKFLHEVLNGARPELDDRAPRGSTTDQRVNAGLELAAHYARLDAAQGGHR